MSDPDTSKLGLAGRIGRLAFRLLATFPPLRATMAASPSERSPPEAVRQMVIALVWGGICHLIFTLAVLSMIAAMWFGMSQSFGAIPQPWAWVANVALLLQFALPHSLLLTRRGRAVLEALAPTGTGRILATTTYAIVASLQLLALFTLWTPSGVIWWEANGPALWLITLLYAASWLVLIRLPGTPVQRFKAGCLAGRRSFVVCARNFRQCQPLGFFGSSASQSTCRLR